MSATATPPFARGPGQGDTPGARKRAHAGRRPDVRVLIVDDEPMLRESLRQLLEVEGGIEVVGEASGGTQGIELALKLSPDVVIMDNRMPDVRGVDAARVIRRARVTTQVIVLSAYDDPSLAEEVRAAGGCAYLVKGCAPSLIVEAIRRAAPR